MKRSMWRLLKKSLHHQFVGALVVLYVLSVIATAFAFDSSAIGCRSATGDTYGLVTVKARRDQAGCTDRNDWPDRSSPCCGVVCWSGLAPEIIFRPPRRAQLQMVFLLIEECVVERCLNRLERPPKFLLSL